MDEKLLTMADLARRWQVHPTTIRNWLNEGVIQSIKGIPSIRFSLDYIQQENERLRDATRAIFQQASQVMGI